MQISILLNGEKREFDVPPNMTLLSLLRYRAGCFSVKHGCETGECGACAVLMDGKLIASCAHLAAQADERELITLEGMPWLLKEMRSRDEAAAAPTEKKAARARTETISALVSSFENPAAFSQQERPTEYDALHPIQQAFVDAHAIQCGYCTPGMALATVALFSEKGLIELPSAALKRKPKRAIPKKRKTPVITEQEAREALAGNLCRCTGYVKPIEAVLQAAEKLKSTEPS